MGNKIIFKGRLFCLSTKKVKLPNGYISDLEVIKHPGAVLIIPFLAKGKVILLRQFRAVLNIYMYELPAGTLKKKELPLDCAKREIIEETGYSAARLVKLGHIYPVPGYSTEEIIIFKAEGLEKKSGKADEDEIIESFIVTKKQVRSMFKSGKIIDAKTICAFTMCGWL